VRRNCDAHMSKGGSATLREACALSVRYCEQRNVRVNESCVSHVNGKEIMICGQRPAGFVYAQVHKNNQQTTGRALGKGSGPLPQSSTVTSSRDVTA
jgi:hypothetical protein